MSAATTQPAEAPAGGKPRRGASLSVLTGGKPAGVSFATVPRANLLPPEIGEREKARGVRRGLRAIVFLAVLVVAAASAGAWFLAFTAQNSLEAAHQETDALLLQKSQFADVQLTQQAIALGQSAVVVGGSTDIDWKSYFRELESQLPAGVQIEGIAVDSATPIAAYTQSETPLEGARIATLTFTAVSQGLPTIPDWLDRLSLMSGFVDATPNSVTLDGETYKVSITMHINASAYSGRFDPQFAPVVEGDESATEETTGTEEDPDGVADGAAEESATTEDSATTEEGSEG